MNADQYCLERAPAEGSSAHYAIRMARDRMQSLTLYVLCRELFAIADISESSVAHAKLAWWRQELGALAPLGDARALPAAEVLAPSQPSHPLSQALLRHGFCKPLALESLTQILDAVDIDLTQSRFLDRPALAQYLRHAAAAPAAALAAARGLDQPAITAAARLGAATGRARLLMDVGRNARQQRIYIPHEVLKEFKVPAADLLQGRATAALKQLATSQAIESTDEALQAVRAMSKRERREMRDLVVYAALTFARLREVGQDGYRVASHRVSLTPLRKLLIAWQTAYLKK